MNFIVYENDDKYINKYKKAIFCLMADSNISYQTIEIKQWDSESEEKIKNLTGSKIYILDIVVPGKNGIDLSRKIRHELNDWISPIIMVSSHKEFKMVGYTEKLYMLDFVIKDEYLEEELLSNLKLALKINNSKKMLSYTHRGSTYQIPYDDIYYIEKILNSNASIIVTKDKEYEIPKSIVEIEKDLCKYQIFYKTHRSCIVNLTNIDFIDYEKSTISFGSKNALLSRTNKSGLKERIEKINI